MSETKLTDAELARLEGDAAGCAKDVRNSSKIRDVRTRRLANAAPSLVAEVRALRRHNQAMRGGNKFVRDSLQAENAALRERVEALEWLVECEQYNLWSHPMSNSCFDQDERAEIYDVACREFCLIREAAREAVK